MCVSVLFFCLFCSSSCLFIYLFVCFGLDCGSLHSFNYARCSSKKKFVRKFVESFFCLFVWFCSVCIWLLDFRFIFLITFCTLDKFLSVSLYKILFPSIYSFLYFWFVIQLKFPLNRYTRFMTMDTQTPTYV